MAKSGKKQVYKTLTKTQAKKASTLAKKGVSQQKIAKKLGIAKQSVATFLRGKGIGKRATGTFWEDVKAYQTLSEESWVESRLAVYKTQKWGKRRAAKHGKSEYKDFKEFWADQKRQYESQEESQEKLAEEMEDTYFESK